MGKLVFLVLTFLGEGDGRYLVRRDAEDGWWEGGTGTDRQVRCDCCVDEEEYR